MADLAKALGLPSTFSHAGKEYALPPVNMEIWASWERKLENEAWLRVERTRGSVPEEIYRERHDAITKLIADRHFRFNGDASTEATETDEGFRWLMAHCVMAGNPGVGRAEADRVVAACEADVRARYQVDVHDPKSNGSPAAEKVAPHRGTEASPNPPSSGFPLSSASRSS